MLLLVVAMLICLILAGLVVLFVAYPHRGERLPVAPWLGDALAKAADSAPTIEDGELDLLRMR